MLRLNKQQHSSTPSLGIINPLNGPETRVSLIENRINPLQPGIPQYIKVQAATALHPTIHEPIARIRERQILLVHGKLLVTDGEADNGKIRGGSVGREEVALLGFVIFATGNGGVDRLAQSVVNESEGGPGVRDGGVAGAGDRLASNNGRSALELPEALGAVDRGVVRSLVTESRLVDVAESVEALAFVGIVGVLVSAQMGGEEFLILRNVLLEDHVLNRRLDTSRLDGVDRAKGQTQ